MGRKFIVHRQNSDTQGSLYPALKRQLVQIDEVRDYHYEYDDAD